MNSSHTPHKPSAGFTLVELMVTLGVAAILAAIAMPNLRTYVLNVRRDSVVDSLVSSLHYARNQALNLDQVASVCAGVAAPAGTVCPAGTWGDGWQVITLPAGAATVATLTTHTLQSADQAPAVGATKGNLFIAFNGLGLLAPTMAVPDEIFAVCDVRGSTYAREVEVNATGYIQSSTPGYGLDGTTAIPVGACP